MKISPMPIIRAFRQIPKTSCRVPYKSLQIYNLCNHNQKGLERQNSLKMAPSFRI